VRWLRRDDGLSSVEYALIAFFIAVAAVLGITALGMAVDGLYEQGVTEVGSERTP
jgi:Flp pilus assembly pilin Flp